MGGLRCHEWGRVGGIKYKPEDFDWVTRWMGVNGHDNFVIPLEQNWTA